MPGFSLVSTSGDHEDKKLGIGSYAVGRKESNDIQIKHLNVSGKHAVLHVAVDRVVVEDKSRNGVYINDRRVNVNDTSTCIAFVGDRYRPPGVPPGLPRTSPPGPVSIRITR
jgi:pSer/pThr/pTyr-binding forkhead associated (FHA) protein